jgi:hypothetical protein
LRRRRRRTSSSAGACARSCSRRRRGGRSPRRPSWSSQASVRARPGPLCASSLFVWALNSQTWRSPARASMTLTHRSPARAELEREPIGSGAHGTVYAGTWRATKVGTVAWSLGRPARTRVHFIPDSLRELAPLFPKRQCDRTLPRRFGPPLVYFISDSLR